MDTAIGSYNYWEFGIDVAELCFTSQVMLKDHKIIKKSNLIAIQLTHLFHALFANLKLKYLKIIGS